MNKPNILLITSDQQCFDTLSAVVGKNEIYTSARTGFLRDHICY